jgi:hypothetical protein
MDMAVAMESDHMAFRVSREDNDECHLGREEK